VGKQRLHLHSGQWRSVPNTNAHCYRNGDTYSNADSYGSSKSNTNAYSYRNGDAYLNANSDIHSHTNSRTVTDSNADSDTWLRSSGDGKSGAGFDVYFFSRDVPMDRGQRKSVCSNLGEPTERT
jgi:hypothetical protein